MTRRRRFVLAALGLLGVGVLLVVSGVVFLIRTDRGRRFVFERAAIEIERATGAHVTGRLATLSPFEGTIVLLDVTIGVAGQRPFLRADELKMKVDLESLRNPPLVLRSVEIAAPRADLGAPIPSPPSSFGPSRGPSLEVLSFVVKDGSATSAPSEKLAWAAGGIAASGSYRSGALVLSIETPAALVSGEGETTRRLHIQAAGRRAADGTLALDTLNVAGEGLSLEASGRGGLDGKTPLAAKVKLEADLSVFAQRLEATGRVMLRADIAGTTGSPEGDVSAEAADLSWRGLSAPRARLGVHATRGTAGVSTLVVEVKGGGLLEASGSADLTKRTGDANVSASGLPLDVLGPLLPRGTIERFGLSATRLDGTANVSLTSFDAAGVTGAADVVLWREQERVGVARVSAEPAARGVAVKVSLDLFPGDAGRRTLRASLRSPSLPRLAESAGEADLVVDAPDIASFIAKLHRTWPALVPEVRQKIAGSVSAAAHVAGTRRDYTARLTLEGANLTIGDSAPADTVRLTARATPREGWIESLSVRSGARVLSAAGRTGLADAFRDAELALTLEKPTPELDRVALDLRARGGVLEVRNGTVASPGGTATFTGSLPLGALRRVPELAGKLGFLPKDLPDGLATVHAESHGLDSAALLSVFGSKEREERATLDLALALRLDPADLLAASGDVTLSNLHVSSGTAALAADRPVVLHLADRRLVLEKVSLQGTNTSLSLASEVGLGTKLDDPVRRLTLDAQGTVEGLFLDPFLAGGIANGAFDVSARIAGPPRALEGSLAVQGKGASLFWPTPYASKLTDVDLFVLFSGTAATITRGTASLNGGAVSLSGGWAKESGLALVGRFQDVRYRFAYGLLATLAGELTFEAPPADRRSLGGSILLDRGILDRDVDLDREILTRFLSPPESLGTEQSFLDTVDLDLTVKTTTGIRVRNNVADLLATWGTLDVTGTLKEPVIVGRIDIQKGGIITAYNQTFRIDKGSLTYVGDPSVDPRIEVTTTSAREDPSIARRGAESSVFDTASAPDESTGAGAFLAAGLAGYYGERVASRLGESLGFSRVKVLVYGETDPGARLTLSRDFSRYVAFTFSLDLTNAQRQTYLVNLHDLSGIPTLTTQVFTRDDGGYGDTIQQTLELGGTPKEDAKLPRLGKIVVTPPPGLSKRKLLYALRVKKGDPVSSTTAFDVEVSLGEALRDAGYPDARGGVHVVPGKKVRTVDLVLDIDPGIRTRFVFEGDTPPGPTRRSITSLYRGDFYEASSIDDMRRRTVRLFRALSHLEPRVDIRVERTGEAERRVTIRTEAGERVELLPPRFEGPGLAAEESAFLAARFPGPVERAELATATPDARHRVLALLAALGFPEARFLSIERDADGRTPLARVETGPRTRVESVEVAGVEPEERGRLLSLVRVRAGDPARSDAISAGTLRLTEDLLAGGHADVKVRTRLEPADGRERHLTYEVEAGPAYRLGTVRFEGLRSASRSLLNRVAHLTLGGSFHASDVDAARSRLLDVGIFSAVRSDVEKKPAGVADAVFTFEEKPRWSLGYGVRFENGLGYSGVVDVVDHDLFGRAITLGLRGLYAPGDRSGRLFLGAGDLLGSRVSLQAFLEARRLVRGGLITSSVESTLELSRPVSPRLNVRLYGRYRRSHVFEEDPDPFLPFDVTVAFPYVGAQVVYDTRPDPLLGTGGVFASLDVSGTSGVLGSDFSYVRLFGQIDLYRRLLKVGGIPVYWAQSARIGLARAFADQELIPDVRFFAGGEYSIRGYDRDNVGPHETLGGASTSIGGSTLLVLNEELRFPVASRLWGVTFFDLGNVWTSSRDFGKGLANSVGLGLRAVLPIGVVRVDAARPLDRGEGDPSFKVYVGLGNVF